MKHVEILQKYSAARRKFNSFLSVLSGDKTLRLMLDILRLNQQFRGKWDRRKKVHTFLYSRTYDPSLDICFKWNHLRLKFCKEKR